MRDKPLWKLKVEWGDEIAGLVGGVGEERRSLNAAVLETEGRLAAIGPDGESRRGPVLIEDLGTGHGRGQDRSPWTST